jgi:hypothetical protein
MKNLTTKAHGILDYMMGVLIATSPWLFDFATGGAATSVPVAVGISALVYSALTNYEVGIMKVIPMPTHLLLDYLSTFFLAASPWIFGFSDDVFWPHLVLGGVGFLIASMTESHPRSNTPTSTPLIIPLPSEVAVS